MKSSSPQVKYDDLQQERRRRKMKQQQRIPVVETAADYTRIVVANLVWKHDDVIRNDGDDDVCRSFVSTATTTTKKQKTAILLYRQRRRRKSIATTGVLLWITILMMLPPQRMTTINTNIPLVLTYYANRCCNSLLRLASSWQIIVPIGKQSSFHRVVQQHATSFHTLQQQQHQHTSIHRLIYHNVLYHNLYRTKQQLGATINNEHDDHDTNDNANDNNNSSKKRIPQPSITSNDDDASKKKTTKKKKNNNNNIDRKPISIQQQQQQQQEPTYTNSSSKQRNSAPKTTNISRSSSSSSIGTTNRKRTNGVQSKGISRSTQTVPVLPTTTKTNSLLPPLLLSPPPSQQQRPVATIPSKGEKSKNQQRMQQSSSRPIEKSVSSSSSSSIPFVSNQSRKTSGPQQQQQQQQDIGGNGFSNDRRGTTNRNKSQNKSISSATTTTRGTTNKNINNNNFMSLLPPYSLLDTSSSTDIGDSVDRSKSDDNDDEDDDDFVTNGLSSWEQFLGRGNRPLRPPQSQLNDTNNQEPQSVDVDQELLDSGMNELPPLIQPRQQRLPSIQDLFPPDLTSLPGSKKPMPLIDSSLPSPPNTTITSADTAFQTATTSNRRGGPSFLDGILPVSDLFYRSSQQQFVGGDEHDDEELPFSAEQSDAITSDENKIRVQQNMVEPRQQSLPNSNSTVVERGKSVSKEMNRKMIRRGMEMLVGGVPIQADPPQRSVQITYNQPPKGGADWASTISLNTREFGPLLHTDSIAKVPDYERGLFCEFFCHAAIKWDVCPNDLRQIVNSHRTEAASTTIPFSKGSKSVENIVVDNAKGNNNVAMQSSDRVLASTGTNEDIDVTTEFDQQYFNAQEDESLLGTNGEIRFEIGITRDELETGSENLDGSAIFQSVFSKAFQSILERAINTSTSRSIWDDVVVDIPKLAMHETDDGYTSVFAEFRIKSNTTGTDSDQELRLSKIGVAFSRSMDDGGFALAIAAAAKEEMRWPETVRNRVVEECLSQEDAGDESAEKLHWTRTESPVMYDQEVGLVIPARIGDGRSSLYKGGGVDGVFNDFSAMNVLNAPYSGEIGLRLVDAVTARTKERHPKVIAIGDVHGCIDELQDLLRQCDFRPGDLVVFLGDLVCKGPDSIAVVQMAREIGAIGVRGNHDFEVVRWHQAIKSGVDPPVFGSEHYHIAACLSKADMKWMHSLPWYVSSKDLGALFVHAGFVSGIRLAKQNPRLMMNMRSILPDGTVTSKFFNNWPWARLWDGPQTVLFGHDADRGLQQYEHAIGLDTGCVYGGRLTACILPEKKLVSVSAKREYFKYRRKHYD